MKPIDQIRHEIVALEARIDKLRSVEDVLSSLEDGEPSGRGQRGKAAGKTPSKTIARAVSRTAVKAETKTAKGPAPKAAAAAPSGVREGSIGEAVLELLTEKGPLPRAAIEDAIRNDRDVGKQSISVSLQRLRKAGKVALKDNQWGLKKR